MNENIEINLEQDKLVDQEILDGSKILDPKKENVLLKSTENSEDISKKEDDKENKTISEKIKNLTKEIEYITSNDNGDTFKIVAKYGKTNLENTNILDLEKVDGIISSSERSEILISSDFAKYDYSNQNSKFYRNVVIKYDDKQMTCDYLDLEMKKNIAVAYDNVIVQDEGSIMKAQVIILDLITKDISINSEDKVKILTN
tara:strand:+ start:604 stop:1206 length:603 start_codon:yes stop_codon:yes gene_type:complete